MPQTLPVACGSGGCRRAVAPRGRSLELNDLTVSSGERALSSGAEKFFCGGIEGQSEPEGMDADLQLASAVVDDQHIEGTQGVHAEDQGRLLSEVPRLEDLELRDRDARAQELDTAEVDRRHHHVLGILYLVGRALNLLGRRLILRPASGQGLDQRRIRNGRL